MQHAACSYSSLASLSLCLFGARSGPWCIERDGVDGLGMVFVGFVILDLGVSMGIHILIGELPKK